MNKKRILITGGSGFVGKNLKEYFSDKYQLFVPTHKQLDLLDTEKVDRYISHNQIDYIIHAANIGGKRTDSSHEDIIGANLRMFFNIVRQQNLVKKIIYFGSGAEFDKSGPINKATEEDLGERIPKDDYGFYKFVCARYVDNLSDGKIVCVRLFGVYGKYEDYFVRFISNAIVKNILLLSIDINQNVYFDYLYIKDLMKTVDYFMNHKTKYNIYNAVSGTKIDLITIASKINSLSPYKSKVIIRNKGFNKEYTASNARLRREIEGFRFTTIDDGIKDLSNWYRKNIKLIDREKIISQQSDI